MILSNARRYWQTSRYCAICVLVCCCVLRFSSVTYGQGNAADPESKTHQPGAPTAQPATAVSAGEATIYVYQVGYRQVKRGEPQGVSFDLLGRPLGYLESSKYFKFQVPSGRVVISAKENIPYRIPSELFAGFPECAGLDLAAIEAAGEAGDQQKIDTIEVAACRDALSHHFMKAKGTGMLIGSRRPLTKDLNNLCPGLPPDPEIQIMPEFVFYYDVKQAASCLYRIFANDTAALAFLAQPPNRETGYGMNLRKTVWAMAGKTYYIRSSGEFVYRLDSMNVEAGEKDVKKMRIVSLDLSSDTFSHLRQTPSASALQSEAVRGNDAWATIYVYRLGGLFTHTTIPISVFVPPTVFVNKLSYHIEHPGTYIEIDTPAGQVTLSSSPDGKEPINNWPPFEAQAGKKYYIEWMGDKGPYFGHGTKIVEGGELRLVDEEEGARNIQKMHLATFK